ncbi:uncharacterized protein LOC129575560 isoform X4 [Sitodiplosis mosellana]|nr:uncharacterized protein LOC129575560 isoform X4 [Sitodiplosis mosellana]
MLTEDLPQLLQSLLVSVEQTVSRISRVPFDELAFPKNADEDEIENHKTNDITSGQKLDDVPISPKCGSIKRRENITKNKPLQNRYTLRRMSVKSNSDKHDNKEATDVSALPSSPTTTTNITTSNNMMPLFCLGGSLSFPHIDSDEDSGDDVTKSPNDQACHHDIVAPRSITDLPEKLLTSGVYLSDTHDINGFPIITIETKILMDSGLNCYEVATLMLYYNTIPTNPSKFTLHVIASESDQLSALNLLDNAFNLITGHVHIDNVLVSTLYTTDKLQLQLPLSKIKIIHAIELFDHIPPECAPTMCNGTHIHNQALWREFFVTLELLRVSCVSVGQDLVSVMNEIRLTDSLGMPSRRQLYSQHRALSRALMDSELQCLTRKGQITLTRLQSLAKSISSNDKYSTIYNNTTSTESTSFIAEYSNRHVSHRLREVTVIFGEVDRAARRLEQLTEQRRERLREITRQKAFEEEMKEITKWIQNDGESMLKRYADVPLDSETSIKDCEHDFEKFYFISMKYLAKGRDLEEAALNLESISELRTDLKTHLSQYSDRLETIRERVEGAVRLHHLLGLEFKEKDVQLEMQRLAEKIGALSLIERYRSVTKNDNNPKIDKTSTPFKETTDNCSCWPTDARFHNSRDAKSVEMIGDEDEDHSKIADSGLGGCDRCEMNDKLVRTCSCQSFDEPTNKSHNSDEMEEDCFDNNMKGVIDYQMSPLKPNAHLYSYSSNIALDLENSIGLAPKTQKTLLLIMREMIGTERDYVRSLHYIIDNYMDEMNREDIPQALRGQRNVIFGNVEKICEFHQQYFLHELERCENNPLKVGAVFLEHESKFYLYALYNKNKPKSEALMSEYGSRFFKAKQMELGDKMDLASYLLKPVQRMGKYALLLQQLMKAVTSIQGPTLQEITEDIEELQKAEEMVRFQLRHGNDLLAMDSLRDCDVNVKEQGRLLRQNEFLVWQGRGGKKSLRQVFLFEDLVLFSKARRFPDSKNLDIYIYKNSIKTSDIGLTELVCDSTTKFEIWFRKMKPDDTWTLQSMNEDTKKVWTEEISKLLWKQAKRNRDIRMQEMSSMGIGNKPCLDIRPSQNQINDRSVSRSQLEKAPKLRSSFSSSMAESTKAVQRPNSIISLGSSFSSSTSRSSASTSSSSSNPNTRNAAPGIELDMINETLPLKTVNNSKKYQRSTTLASQLSMESGIIADISTSPDNEDTAWMKSLPTFAQQKSQTDNSIQKRQTSNMNVAQKMTADSDMLGSNSTTNPYINNDSIAVHL